MTATRVTVAEVAQGDAVRGAVVAVLRAELRNVERERDGFSLDLPESGSCRVVLNRVAHRIQSEIELIEEYGFHPNLY
ncbi:hypothetical protein [Pseudonocardia sp. T1-2H]|uniref:hypothetical protein n=1 Tax=Pseudonocardia sp. T1-2H TaxID=3128899 RepID=UPI003100C58C